MPRPRPTPRPTARTAAARAAAAARSARASRQSARAVGTPIEPAAAFRFEVTVDGILIGSFTSCEGLAAEYEVEQYNEGGVNQYVHHLAGRVKYPNVKLSRAVDADSAGTNSLAGWFSQIGRNGSRRSVSRTIAIGAFAGNGRRIASWSLYGAIPVRWTGPSFSSDGNAAAKETLEIAHQGFLT